MTTNILPIKGVKLATINCGIKYKNRDDLLLISFQDGTNAAGVFTSSSMPAAPVTWCKKIVKAGNAKALIVNSGNANAFTGKIGDEIVAKEVNAIAKNLDCANKEIFVSSTGVIGEILNVDLIVKAIPTLVKNFKSDEAAWDKAAKAIMTTDTKQKIVSKSCKIDGKTVSITGFAKGSGMIAPNMATMLGYIFTDANISKKVLSELLKEFTNVTFNSITVDSDQSTNDTVLLFATKQAGNKEITNSLDKKLNDFEEKLFEVMKELALMIVVDGEGAKKLIEIEVDGGKTKKQTKEVAFAIANSPLVKTALAAADPNWGRIAMAVGKSCKDTTPEKLIIKIGEFQITKDGKKHPDYVESKVHEYLKNSEVKISIDLGIKKKNIENKSIVWTCDLNEEYIKINKDYRT